MDGIIKLFSDEERKIFWVSFFFLFFVFTFETYRLNISYSEYIIYLFDAQDIAFSLITLFCIVISFCLFYLFIVFALSSFWFYKTICFLLFAAAAFVEFSFQKALGRFSDSLDIQNAVATTTDQQIASLLLYFNFAALIPCLVFLLCLVFIKRQDKCQGLRNLLLVFGLFALFHVLLSEFGGFFIERKFPTSALVAFCRTNSDFIVAGISINNTTEEISRNKSLRQTVQKPALAENLRPANNIVFVVDESVMGSQLSLNGYNRLTTPFLDNLAKQGSLHNWGTAVSASTGSRFTYNALITGLTPDDLPDKTEYKINSFPTIFQYAKAMNYTTYYFDGQMKNYWGGVADDKNYIDNWIGVDRVGDFPVMETWDIDNQIARRVNKIIEQSSGNFIFIFKHGCHIPYQKNFPASEAIWFPTYTTDDLYAIPKAEKSTEVVNAYDNSLRYNINSFFKNLIDDYSDIPNDSVIIYTGDHGQTLFAGAKASHGGETKIEASVPLFIVGKLASNIDTGYKASHQNLYPTLLDLMNYPEELRERKDVPSLFKAKASDSKPRFFNPNLGKKIPFD